MKNNGGLPVLVNVHSNASQRWLSIIRICGILLILVTLFTSCIFLDVRNQEKKLAALCQLWGTVQTEHSVNQHMVIIISRKVGGMTGHVQMENLRFVDYLVVEGGGRWVFFVKPDIYEISAFEDINEDLVRQTEEAEFISAKDKLINCEPGEIKRDIMLTRISHEKGGQVL